MCEKDGIKICRSQLVQHERKWNIIAASNFANIDQKFFYLNHVEFLAQSPPQFSL